MDKVLIITNNDNVWLKPAWSKVINSNDHNFEFNFITLPERKINKMNPLIYYFQNFGFKNVILLSFFSVIRMTKFYKVNKNTFRNDITMNLNSFDIEMIEKKLKDFKPSIVFITCSYIIPKQLINFSKDTSWFNKHASILPNGKGVFPYVYNTIDGLQQGISFHYVTEFIDAGDIVYLENIDSKKTMVAFYKEIYDNFDNYFLKFCKNLKLNVRHKQESNGSYYSYPDKKVLKTFYKAGGKIINLKDIINE
jgi:folate-dependent phosphoribosylglycinamide formyltransferase PurN